MAYLMNGDPNSQRCCICDHVTESVNDLLEHISNEHLDVEDFDQDIDPDLDMMEMTDDFSGIDRVTKPRPRKRKNNQENNSSFDNDTDTEIFETQRAPRPKSVQQRKTKRGAISSYTIRGFAIVIKGICCNLCNFKSTNKQLMNTHKERRHGQEPASRPEIEPYEHPQNDSETQHVRNPNLPRPKPKCKQVGSKLYNPEMYPYQSNNIPPFEYKQPYIPPNQHMGYPEEHHTREPDSSLEDLLYIEPTISYDQPSAPNSSMESKFIPKVELNTSNYQEVASIDSIACWFCKIPFGSVVALNIHINEVHYKKPEVQAPAPPVGPTPEVLDSAAYCFLCSKQFKNKKVLIEHNFQKHAEKHLPCDQCHMMFSRQSHLTKHLREKHILINVKCKFCSKVFASVKTLQPHLLVVHEYRMQKNEEHLFASDDANQNLLENQYGAADVSQGQSNENGSDPGATMSRVPCPQCPRFFKNKRKLYAHRVIAHEEKTIMCHDCGAIFARQNQLRRHVRFTHNLKMNVPCPHCDLVLFNEISLYRHNRIQHKDKRFPCQFCTNYFPKREELKEHHALVHPDITTFKCPACPKELSTYTRLIKHERSEHQMKPYGCTECTAKYSTNQTLQKHIIVVHRGEEYTKDKYASCTECSKLLFSKWHLRRHMINNHSGPNTIHCSTCFITFPTSEELEHHVTSTHPIVKFQCDVCKKEFNNKSHFNRHTRITHPNPNQLNCDICNQLFESNALMKEHLTSAHPLSKYECALCQKEFSYKWHLKRHVLTVHSNKPTRMKSSPNLLGPQYDALGSQLLVIGHDESMLEQESGSMLACDICQKMYSNKWHLKRHFVTKHSNSNIEKVPCDMCESTFASKWHLNRHMDEKHSAIKKFECNICLQKFTAKRLLKSHTVREHEKAKFECAECGMKFNKENRLERHIAAGHAAAEAAVPEKIQCSSCPRSFKDEIKLQRHQASAHKEKVKSCKLCQAKFSSMEELKTHRDEMHKVKKLRKRAVNRDHFVEVKMEPMVDIKMEPVDNELQEMNDFYCTICNIDFGSKQVLDLHVKVVHCVTLTNCILCHKEFTELGAYLKHITDEHSHKKAPKNKTRPKSRKLPAKSRTSVDQPEEKAYTCKHCSTEFSIEKDLNDHLQEIHYEQSLFEVDINV